MTVAEVTLDDMNQGIEAFVDPATLFIAPPHFFSSLLHFRLDSGVPVSRTLLLDYQAQSQDETAYFCNLGRVPAADLLQFLKIRPELGLVSPPGTRASALCGRIVLRESWTHSTPISACPYSFPNWTPISKYLGISWWLRVFISALSLGGWWDFARPILLPFQLVAQPLEVDSRVAQELRGPASLRASGERARDARCRLTCGRAEPPPPSHA